MKPTQRNTMMFGPLPSTMSEAGAIPRFSNTWAKGWGKVGEGEDWF